jgi:hypothetical protein
MAKRTDIKGKGDSPRWPSLEQQLADAKVIPGSALDSLIRSNQDFSMLWPREANDRLRIPPWLRVHWRKNHPEARYSENDPSGGYPMALHELYEWMIRHQDLKGPEQRPNKR